MSAPTPAWRGSCTRRYGSRLEILADLRHSILVEAPELVGRLVRDFLQD
jgi:hypothetical protein